MADESLGATPEEAMMDNEQIRVRGDRA